MPVPAGYPLRCLKAFAKKDGVVAPYAPASCGAGVPAMRSKVGPRVGLAPVASVGVACPGLGARFKQEVCVEKQAKTRASRSTCTPRKQYY